MKKIHFDDLNEGFPYVNLNYLLKLLQLHHHRASTEQAVSTSNTVISFSLSLKFSRAHFKKTIDESPSFSHVAKFNI